jgi:hypothetical protein
MREEKIKNIQKIEQDTSTERKKKAKKGERAKFQFIPQFSLLEEKRFSMDLSSALVTSH